MDVGGLSVGFAVTCDQEKSTENMVHNDTFKCKPQFDKGYKLWPSLANIATIEARAPYWLHRFLQI